MAVLLEVQRVELLVGKVIGVEPVVEGQCAITLQSAADLGYELVVRWLDRRVGLSIRDAVGHDAVEIALVAKGAAGR